MASEYLSRTPSVAGNRKTFTISTWLKRAKIGTGGSNRSSIFSAGNTASVGANGFQLWHFNDFLGFEGNGGGNLKRTNAVFRDTASWYHIVCAVDTTQSTANNRIRLYVNGSEITSFSDNTAMTQGIDTAINNSGVPQYIGVSNDDNTLTYYQGGLLADFFLVDGQQLSASVFGETSSTTGQWVPKAPSVIRSSVGSFGTNGCYLPFTNKASTTTLGYDYKTTDRSSNNDFTLNNFSTNDGVADGYDNKFTTFNPLYNSSVTYSDANLTAVGDGSHKIVATDMGVKTGKWYWEAQVTGTAPRTVGLAKQNTTKTNFLGSDSTGWGAYWDSPTLTVIHNNSTVTTYTVTATAGDIMMLAFDADAGKFWYGVNGTWLGSGNPATGANAGFTGIGNTGVNDYTFPAVSAYGASGNANQAPIFNFGNPSYSIASPYADGNGYGKFNYQPPSGFLSICEKNITNPAIPKGASHFKCITYTGTGASTRSITGLGFKPDVVWIKSRSGTDSTYYHRFAAIPLGETSGYLSPHSQDANQGSTNGYVSSYDADGFTLTSPGPGVNQDGSTYVAWCWKMSSGSSVTNTSGTITSTVWANPTAGQSLIRWTGAGGGGTKSIGHGLNAAPGLVIAKDTSGGGTNWVLWHKAFPNSSTTQVLSGAMANITELTNYWGSSIPSSSVIYLDATGGYDCNQSGRTMMALAFAEVEGYSKFGSYTYNNSTDGNFIYTGFKPAFILIKNTDNAEQWYILDNTRNTFNGGQTAFLQASTTNAESTCNGQATDTQIDIVSNGFKLRDLGGVGSGELTFGTRPYIYAAFAEVPFDFATAR